MKMIRK